jgi:hypothetical protein
MKKYTLSKGKAVKQLENGTATFTKQDGEKATYAEKIVKTDEIIDFTQTAKQLSCRIRALSPFPYAFFSYNGKRIKITSAHTVPDMSSEGKQAGEVISVKGETITVGDVIEEATMSYGLTLGWTDLDALTMPDYPDLLNEDGTYDMWICLINGSEPKGRTRETEVKAGDKIVYTYTHYTPVEEK